MSVVRSQKSHLTIQPLRAHQMLELFLAKRETAGLSPYSLRNYRDVVGAFVAYPTTPSEPAAWTDEHVDIWLAARRRQPGRRAGTKLSPATLKHDQVHLFVFLKWLHERGELPTDIRRRVERVQVPDKRGRTANLELLGRLLEACELTRFPLRNAAILRLLWSSGLRRREVASLDLADVDLKAGTLRLYAENTKRKRERLGAFDTATKAALLEYITEERPEGTGPLFANQHGRRFEATGMGTMIADLARIAEVEASAHDFRRGFAVHARRNGLDVAHVRNLLGHRTLAMTLKYSEEGEELASIDAYKERIG